MKLDNRGRAVGTIENASWPMLTASAIGVAKCGRESLLNVKPWPIVTVLAIVGFYVSLDVGMTGAIVPNVLGAPFGLILLFVHFRRITPGPSIMIGLLGLYYLFAGIMGAVLVGGGLKLVLPSAQYMYSVVTAYGVYLDLTCWSKKDVNRLFGVMSIFIVAGCYLEVYTPLKGVFNAMQWIHDFVRSDNLARANTFRDLLLYGQVRPRLFTSEASFVSTNFGIFGAIWVLTLKQVTSRDALRGGALLLAALFVIRSPFVILPVLILIADILFNRDRNRGRIVLVAAEVFLFSVVAIAAVIVVSFLFVQFFGQRVGSAQRGSDWSVIARTYGAIVAGWNVALEYPIFGAGPGNFAAIAPIQSQTYIDFHVPEYVVRGELLSKTLNNGIGAALAFFGFIGGFVYFVLSAKLWKSLGPAVSYSFIVIIMVVVSMTAGNIYSPKSVWPQFLIFGALASREIGERASVPVRRRLAAFRRLPASATS